MADLEGQSTAELNVRVWLGGQLLRWIRGEGKDDPRAPAALARLEEQIGALHTEIARRKRVERERNGTPEPEPVVIGLQALHLTARRH